jgi:hypothetical protein
MIFGVVASMARVHNSQVHVLNWPRAKCKVKLLIVDPHNGSKPYLEPQIELEISVRLNFVTCYSHIDALKIQEYMWKMDI